MKFEHSIRIQRELIIHRMHCTQQLDPSLTSKGHHELMIMEQVGYSIVYCVLSTCLQYASISTIKWNLVNLPKEARPLFDLFGIGFVLFVWLPHDYDHNTLPNVMKFGMNVPGTHMYGFFHFLFVSKWRSFCESFAQFRGRVRFTVHRYDGIVSIC